MSSDKVSVSFSAKPQAVQETPSVPTHLGTDFIIIPFSFLVPYHHSSVLSVYLSLSFQSIPFSGHSLHAHLEYIISLKARVIRFRFPILIGSVTQSQTKLGGLAAYKK